MTQQEIIKQIKAFPILEQFKIVEEIQNNIKENLHSHTYSQTTKKDLSVAEKLIIVENLGGALKMKNPPMNKEEEREIIEDYLSEKYR